MTNEAPEKAFDPAAWLEAVKAEQNKIAAARDRLRELAEEAQQQIEDCDDALDHMERAADALSRLV